MTKRPGTRNSPVQIARYLRAAARKRSLRAQVYFKNARLNGDHVTMEADLPDVSDAWELATKLVELEDAWNERRPKPRIRVTLLPAGVPASR